MLKLWNARIIIIICANQQLTESKTTEKAFYDDNSKTPFTTDTPFSDAKFNNNKVGITLETRESIQLKYSNNGSSILNAIENEINQSEARLLLSPIYTIKVKPTKSDKQTMLFKRKTQPEANSKLLLANVNSNSNGNNAKRQPLIDLRGHKILLKLKNILQSLFIKFVATQETALIRSTIHELKKQFSFIQDLLSILNEFNKLLQYVKELMESIKLRVIKFIVYLKNKAMQWREDIMKKIEEIKNSDLEIQLI